MNLSQLQLRKKNMLLLSLVFVSLKRVWDVFFFFLRSRLIWTPLTQPLQQVPLVSELTMFHCASESHVYYLPVLHQYPALTPPLLSLVQWGL